MWVVFPVRKKSRDFRASPKSVVFRRGGAFVMFARLQFSILRKTVLWTVP